MAERVRAPDSATAMRRLIARIRDTIPFDLPAARVCTGHCQGCSLKLLEFLDTELSDWEQRLATGERPGLADLSRLERLARKVHAVLARNGLVEPLASAP